MKSAALRMFLLITLCIILGSTLGMGCSSDGGYKSRLELAHAKEQLSHAEVSELRVNRGAIYSDAGPQRSTIQLPPGSAPSRDEELLIISRVDEKPAEATRADDQFPGSGALVAQRDGSTPTIPVPLKHTDVKAEISGFISRVVVTQQFENPFKEKIEAVYTFPLPQNAAVDDLTMK